MNFLDSYLKVRWLFFLRVAGPLVLVAGVYAVLPFVRFFLQSLPVQAVATWFIIHFVLAVALQTLLYLWVDLLLTERSKSMMPIFFNHSTKVKDETVGWIVVIAASIFVTLLSFNFPAFPAPLLHALLAHAGLLALFVIRSDVFATFERKIAPGIIESQRRRQAERLRNSQIKQQQKKPPSVSEQMAAARIEHEKRLAEIRRMPVDDRVRGMLLEAEANRFRIAMFEMSSENLNHEE